MSSQTEGGNTIKLICQDVFFLGQKADWAKKEDLQVSIDLLDTLKGYREKCVDMAANIIGVKKGIIIANMGFVHAMMFNPRIISRSGSYETEEVCLSLDGVRPCTHYYNIVVEYTDMEVVLRINLYCSRYADNGTESALKLALIWCQRQKILL